MTEQHAFDASLLNAASTITLNSEERYELTEAKRELVDIMKRSGVNYEERVAVLNTIDDKYLANKRVAFMFHALQNVEVAINDALEAFQ